MIYGYTRLSIATQGGDGNSLEDHRWRRENGTDARK